MKRQALLAGEPYWRAAGVREKINLLIGPATEVLGDMLAVSKGLHQPTASSWFMAIQSYQMAPRLVLCMPA